MYASHMHVSRALTSSPRASHRVGAQADKFVVAHNRERVGLARKAHDCGRLRALVDKVSGENEGVTLLVGDLVQERAQLLVAAVHVAHDDGAPFLRSGGQKNVLGRLAASVASGSRRRVKETAGAGGRGYMCTHVHTYIHIIFV